MSYAAQACGGVLRHGDPATLVLGVTTDSRQCGSQQLFFALNGDNFDGHNFLDAVAERGVAGVVVQAGRVPATWNRVAVIETANPRAALGSLAARYRSEFDLPLIAIGGSNGKTTTKELVASVLRQRFATLWSEASYNNDIGIPVTLLRLENRHQAAVVEAGTNHPGELAPLIRMAQPRFGVITSLGREHLEFFHDLDGVAREEGWLAELLPPAGKLFVNADSPAMDQVIQRTRASVVRVGLSALADWTATGIRVLADGTVFTVTGPRADLNGEYRIRLLGRHQVTNALLALALGAELGLTPAELAAGLLACEAPAKRLQARVHNGVTVLDDSYNANADSIGAALRTLADLPCAGRRVAVLGDMGELGAASDEAHAEAGRRAVEAGVDQLFVTGKMGPVVADAARAAGLGRVAVLPDVETTGTAAVEFVRNGDVVLIKASRFMRLERVAARLRGGE